MKKIRTLTSWITQALFVVAIVSGIPLVFFYHPTNAYNSVQKITFLIPYGFFIRKLHYFSSELLLVFIILHLLEQMFSKETNITKLSWTLATTATALIILLLFTGFILKADQGGHSAALVAISMVHNLPGISILSRLFESYSHYFYYKFFLWHILLLPVLVSLLLNYHSKRIDAPIDFVSISIALSIIAMVILPFPKDIPLNITVHGYIGGPWFFEGVERMLDFGMSNVIIVLLSMLLPFLIVLYFPFAKNKNIVKFLFFLWLIFYVSISLV